MQAHALHQYLPDHISVLKAEDLYACMVSHISTFHSTLEDLKVQLNAGLCTYAARVW